MKNKNEKEWNTAEQRIFFAIATLITLFVQWLIAIMLGWQSHNIQGNSNKQHVYLN